MNAFDEGFDLFKREPELMLTEVWWRAHAKDGDPQEFVEGYKAARKQHDEYKTESKK